MEHGRSKTCIVWEGREMCNTSLLCPQNLKEGDHFDSVGIGKRIT